MRKIILSVILITILVLTLFSSHLITESKQLGAHLVELKLDTGDTAWMIVAAALVGTRLTCIFNRVASCLISSTSGTCQTACP